MSERLITRGKEGGRKGGLTGSELPRFRENGVNRSLGLLPDGRIDVSVEDITGALDKLLKEEERSAIDHEK